MSNSNTNLQTQSSNALHNAIMEAGSKDRPPPMLARVNLFSGDPGIKRYINTNLNSELIHIILLTVRLNDIYSTLMPCLMHVKCGKLLKRLKQGESINVQDLETNLYWEFGKFTSRDGGIHLRIVLLRFYR
ncbi:hypothetical protein Tco_0214352 [Tanacetum coccineum]